MRQQQLGQQRLRAQVHVDDGIPRFDGEHPHRLRQHPARGMHQPVDAVHRRGGLLDGGGHGVGVTDVDDDAVRPEQLGHRHY